MPTFVNDDGNAGHLAGILVGLLYVHGPLMMPVVMSMRSSGLFRLPKWQSYFFECKNMHLHIQTAIKSLQQICRQMQMEPIQYNCTYSYTIMLYNFIFAQYYYAIWTVWRLHPKFTCRKRATTQVDHLDIWPTHQRWNYEITTPRKIRSMILTKFLNF